jgi:hypothetical protein
LRWLSAVVVGAGFTAAGGSEKPDDQITDKNADHHQPASPARSFTAPALIVQNAEVNRNRFIF